MTNHYNPKSFWDERFLKYGHTGEVDSLLYVYDQPQRLRAIAQALTRAKIPINSDTKILDIGCGTGDLIELFMKYGEPEIVGTDLSEETIGYVRSRFATNRKVKLLTVAIEEMDLPPGSFDVVAAINVLQHITDDQAYSRAVENMAGLVKRDGHILTMDFSPIKVKNSKPAPYVIVRSRQEYIDAFEDAGCRLVSEFGLPRIGVRLYRMADRVFQRVKELRHSQTGAEPRAVEKPSLKSEQAKPPRSRIGHLMRVILLKLLRPLDYCLSPCPSKYTDMRILIFEKVPR